MGEAPGQKIRAEPRLLGFIARGHVAKAEERVRVDGEGHGHLAGHGGGGFGVEEHLGGVVAAGLVE